MYKTNLDIHCITFTCAFLKKQDKLNWYLDIWMLRVICCSAPVSLLFVCDYYHCS